MNRLWTIAIGLTVTGASIGFRIVSLAESVSDAKVTIS